MKQFFKQLKDAAAAIAVKLLVMLICFLFWFNILRAFNMAFAVAVGIVAAAIGYAYMKKGSKAPPTELEIREGKNKIVRKAARNASRYLLLAFNKLKLQDGITATVYNEVTDEFFKITFRKINAFEAMQAPDLRRDLQAAEKAEKEIFLKANGYKTGKSYY